MNDQEIDRTKLPIRRALFQGVTNQTLDGSQPVWALIAAWSRPRARMDGSSAKELKAGLAEARAGMGS